MTVVTVVWWLFEVVGVTVREVSGNVGTCQARARAARSASTSRPEAIHFYYFKASFCFNVSFVPKNPRI